MPNRSWRMRWWTRISTSNNLLMNFRYAPVNFYPHKGTVPICCFLMKIRVDHCNGWRFCLDIYVVFVAVIWGLISISLCFRINISYRHQFLKSSSASISWVSEDVSVFEIVLFRGYGDHQHLLIVGCSDNWREETPVYWSKNVTYSVFNIDCPSPRLWIIKGMNTCFLQPEKSSLSVIAESSCEWRWDQVDVRQHASVDPVSIRVLIHAMNSSIPCRTWFIAYVPIHRLKTRSICHLTLSD